MVTAGVVTVEVVAAGVVTAEVVGKPPVAVVLVTAGVSTEPVVSIVDNPPVVLGVVTVEGKPVTAVFVGVVTTGISEVDVSSRTVFLPPVTEERPPLGAVTTGSGTTGAGATTSYREVTSATSAPVALAISEGLKPNWFIVAAMVASSALGLAKNQSNICWSEIAIFNLPLD